jgi:hypothetical protein
MADLAARGLHATPAQFQRWRKARLLDPPVRPGAGRGEGRPSLEYPPAAADQAAAIIRLLGNGVPLPEMAMAMFLDAVPVSEAAVRKALHSILADPKSENLDEEAREGLAEWRVNHLQRRGRRIPLLQDLSNMTRAVGNRNALADIVNAMVYAQQLGERPSDLVVEKAAKMLGASSDDISDFYQYQIDLRPEVLREAIDTVSLQELRQAQTLLEDLPEDILPTEAKQNYQFVSINVLGFAVLLGSGDIEIDVTFS